jgi:predicted nucleic acid-binding Zn ribbon protein
MSLDDLDRILRSLARQPEWESYRHYCQALEAWKQVIPPRLVDRTRLVSRQNGVLSVATCSAVLAQELSLQRYSLLQKINRFLDEPLEDLRFSSARWFDRPPAPPSNAIDNPAITSHPSYLPGENGKDRPREEPVSAKSIERWTEKIRQRSLSWPPCPRCQAPTPSGEIDRWGCCAFCSVSDPDEPS